MVASGNNHCESPNLLEKNFSLKPRPGASFSDAADLEQTNTITNQNL